MLTYTLYGPPRTKKNSQRVFRLPSGGTRIAPSAAYVQYEWDCLRQLPPPSRPLAGPVNVKCLYFMPTRRRVDLVNLLEATCDILVKLGCWLMTAPPLWQATTAAGCCWTGRTRGWRLRSASCNRLSLLTRRKAVGFLWGPEKTAPECLFARDVEISFLSLSLTTAQKKPGSHAAPSAA